MTLSRRLTARALGACAPLLLAGCSLLGGGEKAVLYRLGSDVPAAIASAPAGTVPIRIARPELPPGADGDRILTVHGREAAHVAGSRWVGPAPDLLAELLADSLARTAGPAYVLRGGGSPQFVLTTGVTRFAAFYEAGPAGPPVVRVAAQVELRRTGESRPLAVALHSAQRQAAENRVSAIADAFGGASRELTDDIARWAQQQVGRSDQGTLPSADERGPAGRR